jgi:hypothetical protein
MYIEGNFYYFSFPLKIFKIYAFPGIKDQLQSAARMQVARPTAKTFLSHLFQKYLRRAFASDLAPLSRSVVIGKI